MAGEMREAQIVGAAQGAGPDFFIYLYGGEALYSPGLKRMRRGSIRRSLTMLVITGANDSCVDPLIPVFAYIYFTNAKMFCEIK